MRGDNAKLVLCVTPTTLAADAVWTGVMCEYLSLSWLLCLRNSPSLVFTYNRSKSGLCLISNEWPESLLRCAIHTLLTAGASIQCFIATSDGMHDSSVL